MRKFTYFIKNIYLKNKHIATKTTTDKYNRQSVKNSLSLFTSRITQSKKGIRKTRKGEKGIRKAQRIALNISLFFCLLFIFSKSSLPSFHLPDYNATDCGILSYFSTSALFFFNFSHKFFLFIHTSRILFLLVLSFFSFT